MNDALAWASLKVHFILSHPRLNPFTYSIMWVWPTNRAMYSLNQISMWKCTSSSARLIIIHGCCCWQGRTSLICAFPHGIHSCLVRASSCLPKYGTKKKKILGLGLSQCLYLLLPLSKEVWVRVWLPRRREEEVLRTIPCLSHRFLISFSTTTLLSRHFLFPILFVYFLVLYATHSLTGYWKGSSL